MVLRLSIAGLAVALPLAASVAHASPTFPDAVATHLALPTAPDCLLCHVGGRDTANASTARQPFAVTVKAHGARAEDVASLLAALDGVKADKTDSDGDGNPDIAEVVAGTNPNDPASGADPDAGGVAPTSGAGESYHTGCGGNVAPHPSFAATPRSLGSAVYLALLLGTGAALARLARRPRGV